MSAMYGDLITPFLDERISFVNKQNEYLESQINNVYANAFPENVMNDFIKKKKENDEFLENFNKIKTNWTKFLEDYPALKNTDYPSYVVLITSLETELNKFLKSNKEIIKTLEGHNNLQKQLKQAHINTCYFEALLTFVKNI